MLRTGRNTVRADENTWEPRDRSLRLSSQRRPYVLRKRLVQVGEGSGNPVHVIHRNPAETRLAPACPSCGKQAQLVSRDELFPFRADRRDLAPMYYVCCGNTTPADEKTLAPKYRLRNHVLTRLRAETHRVVMQLCKAEFGFGFASHVALENTRDWLCKRLHLDSFDVSTASVALCHDVLRVCNNRLVEFRHNQELCTNRGT